MLGLTKVKLKKKKKRPMRVTLKDHGSETHPEHRKDKSVYILMWPRAVMLTASHTPTYLRLFLSMAFINTTHIFFLRGIRERARISTPRVAPHHISCPPLQPRTGLPSADFPTRPYALHPSGNDFPTPCAPCNTFQVNNLLHKKIIY